MALMPPMITRKKDVVQKFNPDTFRIFGEVADLRRDQLMQPRDVTLNRYHKMPDLYATSVTLPSEIIRYGKRNSEIDYRKNRPHPIGCNFLRENARLLNEPICSVQTMIPVSQMDREWNPANRPWWPSYRETPPLTKPRYTLDTTVRGDFQYNTKQAPSKSTRHSANPNFNQALGIVPVNTLQSRDGQQRFFKERLSYEHAYDSRQPTNYPIRAKRHGAFVYERMNTSNAQKYVSNPGFKAMKPGWSSPLDFTNNVRSSKTEAPSNE